jgi:hypothetical protein
VWDLPQARIIIMIMHDSDCDDCEMTVTVILITVTASCRKSVEFKSFFGVSENTLLSIVGVRSHDCTPASVESNSGERASVESRKCTG